MFFLIGLRRKKNVNPAKAASLPNRRTSREYLPSPRSCIVVCLSLSRAVCGHSPGFSGSFAGFLAGASEDLGTARATGLGPSSSSRRANMLAPLKAISATCVVGTR